MKVNREKFLAAAIALSTAASSSCKLASKAEELLNQASPETSASALPVTGQAPAPAPTEQTVTGAGETGGTKSPSKTTTRSGLAPSTTKGSTLVSPTKEPGATSPTKELAAPTKEIGPAPTKEIASPTKEYGAKPPPPPTKER